MPSPSVVFSSLPPSDQEAARRWARFRDHLAAGPLRVAAGTTPSRRREEPHADAASHGGGIFWRLVASNHREIARSYYLYRDTGAAEAHLRMLRTYVEDLEIHAIRGERSGTHGWVALLRGAPVITCSRWYGSPHLTAETAAAATRSLQAAVIVPPRPSRLGAKDGGPERGRVGRASAHP